MALNESPMYRAFVEVVPEASGFNGILTGQVTAASDSAGKEGGKAAAGGFVSGFGKTLLGASAVAGLSLGIGALIGNAMQAIGDGLSNASSFEQISSAVEDVFEGSAGTIQKFAKASAKSIGLSSLSALNGATDLGLMGKAAGLTGDDLAEFSTDLLGLAADMAAFRDVPIEQAIGAIGSAFRGEMEPIRVFGVQLDDAALKAKALELGIYDGNGALTAQQKTLAANASLWQQTAVMQGQAAQEAESMAGKQAILAAQWENISVRLGQAFMPVAEEVVDWMTADMIPALEDFTDWLNAPDTQQGIKDLGTGVKETGNFLRDYFVAPLSDSFGAAQGLVQYLNGDLNFDEFKAKLVELPGFWGMVFRAAEETGTKVGSAVGTMIWHVTQFANGVRDNVTTAVGWFLSIPDRITGLFVGAGSWLYNSGRAVIQGFVDGIDSMFRPVGDAVSGVLGFVKGFFPNSPAEHGPFSGSGWTALANSGAAIAEQFASGLEKQYRQLQSVTGGLVQAAVPAGSAGGPTVQMTINPAEGLSEEMIGRVAAERLNFALRGIG
ncbi:hypothetical protein [Microbacterium sp. E-13]|uniref:hypothetical protein n=1 Tax=Microbacterium sp. E-13 TaxID=3404048 RepID=UPI003CF9A7D2